MNGISSVTIWLGAFQLSICFMQRSLFRAQRARHCESDARTLTRQAEIRKRGRNWQPTDGRLQRQSSGSNGDRKQDELRSELLVNADLCQLMLRFFWRLTTQAFTPTIYIRARSPTPT